jgi:hypothetical protein
MRVCHVDGHHDFNSLKILAARPAPVQATWLGFAASTGQGPRRLSSRFPVSIASGVPAVDYIIADTVVLPPDLKYTRAVTENLVLLPICYQPQDEERNRRIAEMGELTDDHYLHLLDRTAGASASTVELERGSTNAKTATHEELIHWQAEQLIARRDAERERLLSLMHDAYNMDLSQITWLISFNRQEKIMPEVFHDWMQVHITIACIMKRVHCGVCGIDSGSKPAVNPNFNV